MKQSVAKPDKSTLEAVALTKATVRAAVKLGLTNKALAAIVGLSEPTVSRMSNGGYVLARGAKAFELGVLFVRLFRSLDAITGGDEEGARVWLRSPNQALRDTPMNLIQSVGGLVNVVQYLDSRRARI